MREQNFQDYLEQKKRACGEKFDPSSLNPNFVRYFESQQRIEVDFGYEKKRGRIGVTTGWRPVFLLMLRVDSVGSSHTIGESDKVVKVIST